MGGDSEIPMFWISLRNAEHEQEQPFYLRSGLGLNKDPEDMSPASVFWGDLAYRRPFRRQDESFSIWLFDVLNFVGSTPVVNEWLAHLSNLADPSRIAKE